MVSNGFTRKKVGSMTLGEKLVKLRSDGRISLAEVSKVTRIQVKYLEYLESGQYDKLPAEVYVKGFLRAYANYLGVPDKVLIRLYERDRGIRRNINHEEKKEEAIQPIKFSRFLVTPKILAIGVSAVVIVGMLVYFYREVSSFLSEPYLAINAPVNGQVVNGNEVQVKGETEKGAQLQINNQPTITGDNGEFSETLMLQPGANTITITTKNKLNKETTKIVTVQSNVEKSDNTETAEMNSGDQTDQEKVKMKVAISSAPTWISVKADGAVIFSGILDSGVFKEFEANVEFQVDSDKGSNADIFINGEERGKLSEKSEVVKDILFKK
jgi:cytoskeletal protein RodZ